MSKSVKVCHFTSVHSAYDDRIFYKECKLLAASGFDVYLVAPNTSSEYSCGVHIEGVRYFYKSRIYRLIIGRYKVYRRALKLNADIYHLHDPELLPFAKLLKRRTNAKVIFDSHEFYGMQILESRWLPRCLRSFFSTLYLHYETNVCKLIDAVIAVCTVSGKNYFDNRCKRCELIPNVPDVTVFHDKHEIPFESRTSVSMVGSLTFNRGCTEVVKAAGLTSSNIVLVGRFDSQSYKNEIVSMPEFKKIDFRGYVPNNLVPDILSNSFAGISTLHNTGQYYKVDTFSVKVYEYMSMGLPVILSNSPYYQTIVDKYFIGICVDPTSPKKIADAINFLAANKDIAERMGRAGEQLIRTKLNWGIVGEKLLGLYNSLLEES